MATSLVVCQTLAHTNPSTHSSSFNLSTGSPSSTTGTRSTMSNVSRLPQGQGARAVGHHHDVGGGAQPPALAGVGEPPALGQIVETADEQGAARPRQLPDLVADHGRPLAEQLRIERDGADRFTRRRLYQPDR